MNTLEDLDNSDQGTGNADFATSPDLSMEWGVRWDDGAVKVEADLEAAQATIRYWAGVGVPAVLVSRTCQEWTEQ